MEKQYKETDLAYLAGIIDGEGSITIHNLSKTQKKAFYNTAISVTSTDKILIEWLVSKFGSKLLEYTKKQTPENSRRKVYRWQVTGKRLELICRLIKPYLIIKKEEINVMLLMRSTFSSYYYVVTTSKNQNPRRKLTFEGIAVRNQCVEILKKLHCRNYKK